ncbi:hypothetical protein Vadar_023809 [Vaccinium darrowii]|uniref:Uncharacterized protein n=1 Tax=Vaccinium darrowii TaxID=229202 RepID=A0ACB7ZDU6_9ERIC|nr:hypothetical protein Vadar_023809 [Vaccinium darrowii]
MVEGDRNIAFFHAKVTQRRRKNAIAGIQDANGLWCDSQEQIAKEVVQYYQGLFQSDGADQVSEVVDTIKARVNYQMNQSLTRPVSYPEIQQALFDIDPNKAPGSDGMTAGFYQWYWDVVGADVVGAVQQLFHTGHMLRSWNHTQLVLIPKVKTPLQEGFSSLLKFKEEHGSLKGVRICRNGPVISHLLFADDSLVFCKASKEESEEV